jgi:hypothetical protein
MNTLIVIFTPTGSSPKGSEAARLLPLPPVGTGDVGPVTRASDAEKPVEEELPLWTWFIPNPTR